jgi:tetratricopeptide (TPR) repeat protein
LLIISRCNLLEDVGDKKRALQGYRRLLGSLKAEQGREYLETSRQMARLLHERGDIETAMNVISAALEKHPEAVQPEYINLLMELMISLAKYPEALQVACSRCAITFDSDLQDFKGLSHEGQLAHFKAMEVPEDTPLDIKVKLMVTLIHLKAGHLVEALACQLLR